MKLDQLFGSKSQELSLFLVSDFGGWTLEVVGGPEKSLGPSGKAKLLSAAKLGENLTSVWSRSQ